MALGKDGVGKTCHTWLIDQPFELEQILDFLTRMTGIHHDVNCVFALQKINQAIHIRTCVQRGDDVVHLSSKWIAKARKRESAKARKRESAKTDSSKKNLA